MQLPSQQPPIQPLSLVKGTDGRYGLQPHPASCLAPTPASLLGGVAALNPYSLGGLSVQVPAQAQPPRPIVVQSSAAPPADVAIPVQSYRRVHTSPSPTRNGRGADDSRVVVATSGLDLLARHGHSPQPQRALAAEPSRLTTGGLGFEPPSRRQPSRERLDRLAPEVAPPERLRSKLLDLGTTFVGLDKRVGEDVRQRKEIEQKQMQEILHVLDELEKSLVTETQRRESATTALQQGFEKLLEEMVTRVQGKILERFTNLSRSVEALCERCSTVERGIRQFKGELPSKLRVESARLKQKIRELSRDFQSDRRRRVELDTAMTRELEEVEYNLDLRMQQELAKLERQMESLQEVIDAFASGDRSEETKHHQTSIMESIAEFRNDLMHESRVREQADDQVVQAINEYSSMLYRSLSVTNNA